VTAVVEHAQDSSARRDTPRACRVADACEHAERQAKLEIGGAIHPARLPIVRSGCGESPLAF
jgi:hypothetical protein